MQTCGKIQITVQCYCNEVCLHRRLVYSLCLSVNAGRLTAAAESHNTANQAAAAMQHCRLSSGQQTAQAELQSWEQHQMRLGHATLSQGAAASMQNA